MPTSFQERVYACVRRIPVGRVATYGEVARCLGCGSPRAIGQALRVNPYAPEVPCHRVVGASGALTGFMGGRDDVSLGRKIALLRSEGVEVEDGRVSKVYFYAFEEGEFKRG